MSLRKIGKEEFVLRATADIAEAEIRRRRARARQDYEYKNYAQERHTAYIRRQRNNGRGLKGAALQ